MTIWLVLVLFLVVGAIAFLLGKRSVAKAMLLVAAVIFAILALSFAAFFFLEMEPG